MFLEYLVNKLAIFDDESDLELHLANCIVDSTKILEKLPLPAKFTDACAVAYTQKVLEVFRCYNIIDIDFQTRLRGQEVAQRIYQQFKSDKMKVNDQPSSKLTVDETVDTSDTGYVDTLHKITTRMLTEAYGPLRRTGGPGEKYRYEYPFVLDKHKFALYDYKKDNGEFESPSDITWHLASTTSSVRLIQQFFRLLEERLCSRIQENNNDCC